MKSLLAYIRRNILLAGKSVFYSIGHYSWFIFALMIIQCFFCTVSLSSFNNNAVQYDVTKEEYSYHCIIRNATEKQYYMLINDTSVRYESSRFYEIVKTVKKGRDNTMHPMYDLYIYFKFDAAQSYKRFCDFYGEALEEAADTAYSVEKTPLLDFSEHTRDNAMYTFRSLALITLLGVAFTYALYHIRTEYFKFTYGVFMTFGGGFGKIYSTSFWEMMFVTLLAFVPSSVLSTLFLKVFYNSRGVSLYVHSSAYFLSFTLSLLITAISLIIPCRRISVKTPISNLIASDNSDKVSSPKYSSEFYKVSVPKKYSLISAWRFRRHHVVIAVCCAFFTAVFVLISYGTGVYTDSLKIDRPEFTVSFTDNTHQNNRAEEQNNKRTEINKITSGAEDSNVSEETATTKTDNETEAEENPYLIEKDEKLEDYSPPVTVKDNYYFTQEMENSVLGLDGVTKIVKDRQTINSSLISHILVDKSNIVNQFEYTYYPFDARYGIFTNVEYHPYTWDEVKTIFHCKYEGDIYDFQDNSVIVSNSVSGKDEFKFKVGDKISVATFLGTVEDAKGMGDGALLSEQLKNYNFEYTELTVCAVLLDAEENDNIVIYIPKELYDKSIGEESAEYKMQSELCREAYIYVEKNMTPSEINVLQDKLTDMFKQYGNCIVTANHSGTELRMAKARNTDVVLYSVALLTLLIAPLIVLFAMRMFNIKREDEFSVCMALGIPREKIKKILFSDAMYVGALSLALFLAATLVGTLIVNKIMNAGFDLGVNVAYSYPFVFAGIGIAVIEFTCLLSALISYIAFVSDSKKEYKINLNA